MFRIEWSDMSVNILWASQLLIAATVLSYASLLLEISGAQAVGSTI